MPVDALEILKSRTCWDCSGGKRETTSNDFRLLSRKRNTQLRLIILFSSVGVGSSEGVNDLG